MEKRRSERQKRLDHYRRTGRVILVEAVPAPTALDSLKVEAADVDPLLNEEGEPRRERSRIWLDRLLFLVEFAAVVGLVYVLFNGVNILRDLNNEVSAALTVPTPSPTPLISAVVLPSGIRHRGMVYRGSTKRKFLNTCARWYNPWQKSPCQHPARSTP